MSLATIISELWRFFKNNLLRIILGALIIACATVGARYYITNYFFTDERQAVEYLDNIYSQDPASFRAIVTIEDGQLFSNPHLYDDYFSTPQVVSRVEEASGVAVQETLINEKTLELYKTPTFRGSIAGIRDTASGVFTFRFLVGGSPEENLKVANAYREILEDETPAFGESHTVDIVVEPSIGEMIDIDTYMNIATPETLNVYRSNDAPSLIVYGVLGFTAGIIIMLFFYFLMRLRKPKISYAFEYAWDMNDQHIVVKKDMDKDLSPLENAIRTPYIENRWVIAQSQLSSHPLGEGANSKEKTFTGLSSINTTEERPQQIVIVVYSNHTDKIWYKEQLTLSKLYDVPVRIVHF